MSWELDQEHLAFQEVCRSFTDREVRPRVDVAEGSGSFPTDLMPAMGTAGLLGLVAADEFGGSEAGALAVAILSEELTRASAGIAVTAGVSAYMAGPHLMRHGSPEQKQRWVARLVSGEAIAAIAVTEPGIGSDVAGITTRARRTATGWVLDGQKMFITNAGIADVIIVAARSGGPRHAGITLFEVPKGTPGVTFSAPLRKLGWHSSDTREISFESAEVPNTAIIGTENRGFHQIMEGFQLERIALAGMGIGHGAECLDIVKAYLRDRIAFGAPLTNLQVIRHRLGLMSIELESARLMTYQAAHRVDAGHPAAADSVARAKYAAAVAANRIVDDAVQLFGGAGFLEETPVARHYRDARVLRIGGGTDEIQLEILTKGLRS